MKLQGSFLKELSEDYPWRSCANSPHPEGWQAKSDGVVWRRGKAPPRPFGAPLQGGELGRDAQCASPTNTPPDIRGGIRRRSMI